MSERENLTAWLVRMSGSLAGTRYPVRDSVTTVGRGAQNDIPIADSPTVSVRHLEIRKDGDRYTLSDLNSTNGTFVNGERVDEIVLTPPCNIQVGKGGPELAFLLDNTPEIKIDQTISAPADEVLAASAGAPKDKASKEHDMLLIEAVAKSRLARQKGLGDQTLIIMRQTLHTAMHRTRRKFVTIIAVLGLSLLGVSGFGAWRIHTLKADKERIDRSIRNIEERLKEAGGNPEEAATLFDRLNDYQHQARNLENNFLYRVTVRQPVDPLEQEIKGLLAEFGAETYTVPSEFLQQVKRFIQQYQGPDHANIENGLGRARKEIDTVRSIFEQQHLPPDLAYMAIVESALNINNSSSAGAAGLWQFTPATARAFGLTVNESVDERLDVRKSTRAACKYIRELILDFGAGSSVMLALAAYNVGPAKVKHAIRRVTDPIKQRNFWYLYRTRALPEETREYVPKVIAVLIIARHPERYGF
jgi:soluble lytic murein transglycosylase-like protein